MLSFICILHPSHDKRVESYVCKTMIGKRTNTNREISHDPVKVKAA